jgi:hypothetical protein
MSKTMGKSVLVSPKGMKAPKFKNKNPLTINEEKVLKRITSNPGQELETYYKGGWEKRALQKLEKYDLIDISNNKAKLKGTKIALSKAEETLKAKGVIKLGGTPSKTAKAPKVKAKTTTVKSKPKTKRGHPGFKAVLSMALGGVSISTPVRYETIKSEKLVNTEFRSPEGKRLQWKYVPKEKKLNEVFVKGERGSTRRAYIDSDGKETRKEDVHIVQILSDGTEKVIEKFKRTNEFKPIRYVDKETMNKYVPESFLRVWGDTPESITSLRDASFKMIQEGKIPVVKFTSGGTNIKYGFIVPRTSGDEFTVEIMVSGTKKNKQRWMPVEQAQIQIKEEVELPEL